MVRAVRGRPKGHSCGRRLAGGVCSEQLGEQQRVNADDVAGGSAQHPRCFQTDRCTHRMSNQDGAIRRPSISDLGDVGGKATNPIRTPDMTGRAMRGEVDGEDTRAYGQMLSESSPLCAIATNAMNKHIPQRRRAAHVVSLTGEG
jgi:hypothetical protein